MREYRSLNVVLLFGSWGVVEMSVFYLLQDDVLCIYIPASRWKLQPPMTPQIDSKTLVADYPGGAESWNFRSPQWIFRRLGALCHSNLGELPSGYVKIAIENGTFIVHLPIKDRDFPGRYVSLPEGRSQWHAANLTWNSLKLFSVLHQTCADIEQQTHGNSGVHQWKPACIVPACFFPCDIRSSTVYLSL